MGSWKFKANIWIFQIASSQWIALLRKKCFLFFFAGRTSSGCEKSLITLTWTTNVQILFVCFQKYLQNMHQYKKIVFARKMIKIWPFTFYNFFTLKLQPEQHSALEQIGSQATFHTISVSWILLPAPDTMLGKWMKKTWYRYLVLLQRPTIWVSILMLHSCQLTPDVNLFVY